MRNFLLRFFISIFALWLTGALAVHLFPNDPPITVNFWGAFSAVILLSVLNTFIAPILRLLTLPLNCMTLGLFSFLINAFLFWMASLLLRPNFQVNTFIGALLGPIVMGLLNGIMQSFVGATRR